MKREDIKPIVIFIIAMIIVLWLVTPYCFGAWDNDLPGDDSTWNNAAGEIRANWDALEVAFGVDLAASGAGKPYYRATAPTTKPDGTTAFTASDNGILWIDSDDGRIYRYVYAASGTLWWPLSDWINVKNYGAVGDGTTDDTTAIQAAITAGAGDTVYFPEGVYLIDTALTISASTRILGAGWGTVIEPDTNANIYVLYSTSDNVIVRDLTVNGDKANQSSSGQGIRLEGDYCRVINCKVYDTKVHGIHIKGDNSQVLNCYVATTDSDGIRFGNTNNNCKAIGNTVYRAAGHGISLLLGTDNVISNNVINEAGYGSANVGIKLYKANKCIISNNTVENSTAGGIVDDTGDTSYISQYITIQGNTVRYNAVDGITSGYTGTGYGQSHHWSITGNIVYGNADDGIDLISGWGCTVTGNAAIGNNDSGISLHGHHNTVVGNTCTSNATSGIQMRRFGTVHCDNNIVIGNICSNNGSDPEDPDGVDGAPTASGITFGDQSGTVYTRYNTIMGNQCYDDSGDWASDLTANADASQAEVAVVRGDIFVPNMAVTVSDDTPTTENLIILSISGNTLTMTTNLANTYYTAQNAVCTGKTTQTYGIWVQDTGIDNYIMNNDLRNNVTSAFGFENANISNNMRDNIGADLIHQQKYVRVKNTSGGTLVQGDVVIMKVTDSTGLEITTTTTAGDSMIYGMVNESIADDAYGDVLVEGYTKYLKVDGTADISVGSMLSAFTTAKIAQVTASGEVAFAIALEAYATNDSAGVIDAVLVTPRQTE